jgi:DNA polymerase I-like protein with 3'-5' exonuclease and polymerase domains
MKKKVILDWESYYDDEISVVTMGNANYVKAADAYLGAVAVGDEVMCGTPQELGDMLSQMAKDPTLEFWAANSNFDQAFFEKYYGPTVNPWQCVLDLGASHQLPRSLAGQSRVALGKVMDKGTRDMMKKRHWADLTLSEKERVQEYCMDDVRQTAKLIEVLPPMSADEKLIAEHTRLQNRRGIYVDREQVEADKEKLAKMRWDAHMAVPWHADEALLSPGALRDWCLANQIPPPRSIAKTDAECDALMKKYPKFGGLMENLRKYRTANTLLEKISSLKARTTEDDILPLELIYCGAPHTRRWSSRGFNIQNLPNKPMECGIGADGKSQTLWPRSWVRARPGKILCVKDYSQIEPRCLQYLAGNHALLDKIREGYKYYEAYASMARGWKGAPGSLKAEYGTKKYTLLKNEAIGLGYGMGVDKFIAYALQNGNVIERKDAEATVRQYRVGNPKVTALWKRMDNLLANAKLDKDHTLQLEMPTGEFMTYFTVRGGKHGNTATVIQGQYDKQSLKYGLWGGMVTENMCQRMSRDLLAIKAADVEYKLGIPVIFTSHDELIAEVDDNETSKTEANAEITRIMSEPPAWAEGLPLEVEGGFAYAYTK